MVCTSYTSGSACLCLTVSVCVCVFRAKPGAVVSGTIKKAPAVPQPEDLIAPGTPIQFDIVLPASEFLDQNRAGGRSENASFRETLILSVIFYFLGSVAISDERYVTNNNFNTY